MMTNSILFIKCGSGNSFLDGDRSVGVKSARCRGSEVFYQKQARSQCTMPCGCGWTVAKETPPFARFSSSSTRASQKLRHWFGRRKVRIYHLPPKEGKANWRKCLKWVFIRNAPQSKWGKRSCQSKFASSHIRHRAKKISQRGSWSCEHCGMYNFVMIWTS